MFIVYEPTTNILTVSCFYAQLMNWNNTCTCGGSDWFYLQIYLMIVQLHNIAIDGKTLTTYLQNEPFL